MQARTEIPSHVLMVGAAIAGLVSPIGLLDLGLCFESVDRDQPQHRGGLAKESFGGLLLVGTPEQSRAGIVDTPKIALRDWLRAIRCMLWRKVFEAEPPKSA